ncbi:hypothetical protein HZH68_012700 [Vespula germanica]|uniref:Odorant receptor n=1 Tax=Vespula germanica TaxID=30212 RepID=A0A834MZL4_VESGE|nr:hypothetical protein HZH68_012700 [Vespula germanica]
MATRGASFVEQHFFLSNRLVQLVLGLHRNQSSNNQLLLLSTIIAYVLPIIIYQMNLLLIRFKRDCEHLSDEMELNIMEKYTKQTKIYAYAIVVLFSFYVISITSSCTLNVLLYLFGTLNDNQLTLPIPINNHLNSGALYYFLFIYQTIAVYILLIIGCVVFVLYLVIIQHACCLFSIIIWKIQQQFTNDSKYIHRPLCSQKSQQEFHWIIDVIKCYRNIFRLSVKLQNTIKIIEFSTYFFGSLFIIYINFYIGQKILNYSNEVFKELCQIPFYLLPTKTQKLLLFMIARSMKPCMLSIGGLFVSSHEVFSQLLQKALSFAMVYYNVQ